MSQARRSFPIRMWVYAILIGAIVIVGLWWFFWVHTTGWIRITTNGVTTTYRPTGCILGAAKNPFLYGAKITTDGPFDLLYNDEQDPSIQYEKRVELRGREKDGSPPETIFPDSCPLFDTKLTWGKAPFYDKPMTEASGYVHLNCSISASKRIEANLRVQRCGLYADEL